MERQSAAQVAKAYVASARHDSDADRWAFDHVSDLTLEHNWEELWAVVREISRIEEPLDRQLLAFVAAGPLEDLVCGAGPEYIDAIEHEAKTNRCMGRLLTGVWGARRADPKVWARVVKFCRAFPEPIDEKYQF